MLRLRERPEYVEEVKEVKKTEYYITLPGHGIPITYLKKVTVTTTREMAPVYALGSMQANTFARGRMGIAGQLEFEDVNVPIPKEFDIYLSYDHPLIIDGVELIEEGSSVDMNGLEVNKTYTFVAKNIRKRN